MKLAILGLTLARVAAAETNADVSPPEPSTIPTARPVVPIDDTRSYGPTARNWWDVGITSTLLFANDTTTVQTTVQGVIGFPNSSLREVRDLYREYNLPNYQLRIRQETFAGAEKRNAGPLTVGLQRYLPISHLAIDPLIYAHVGIEAALSTPWLSGSDGLPVAPIEILDGPDTELAGNGWSIRPASVYVRADALVCRSWSGDIGLEPEAFVPTNRRNEYGTRFHVAVGVSLGCNGNMSPHAPKLTFEYRGRVRMYADGAPVDYRDNLAAGVQFDLGPVMLQAFYKAAPGEVARAAAVGIRLQFGQENPP